MINTEDESLCPHHPPWQDDFSEDPSLTVDDNGKSRVGTWRGTFRRSGLATLPA